MKDVAGSGGIDHVDTPGGPVAEILSVPRQNSIVAERCRRQTTAELTLDRGKRLSQIGLARELPRDIAAHDQVIHFFNQLLHVRVELVEVGDHGNSGLLRPARRQ